MTVQAKKIYQELKDMINVYKEIMNDAHALPKEISKLELKRNVSQMSMGMVSLNEETQSNKYTSEIETLKNSSLYKNRKIYGVAEMMIGSTLAEKPVTEIAQLFENLSDTMQEQILLKLGQGGKAENLIALIKTNSFASKRTKEIIGKFDLVIIKNLIAGKALKPEQLPQALKEKLTPKA